MKKLLFICSVLVCALVSWPLSASAQTVCRNCSVQAQQVANAAVALQNAEDIYNTDALAVTLAANDMNVQDAALQAAEDSARIDEAALDAAALALFDAEILIGLAAPPMSAALVAATLTPLEAADAVAASAWITAESGVAGANDAANAAHSAWQQALVTEAAAWQVLNLDDANFKTAVAAFKACLAGK